MLSQILIIYSFLRTIHGQDANTMSVTAGVGSASKSGFDWMYKMTNPDLGAPAGHVYWMLTADEGNTMSLTPADVQGCVGALNGLSDKPCVDPENCCCGEAEQVDEGIHESALKCPMDVHSTYRFWVMADRDGALSSPTFVEEHGTVVIPLEDQDCEGVWSTCNSDCQREYTLIKFAQGDGATCTVADGDVENCAPGDDYDPVTGTGCRSTGVYDAVNPTYTGFTLLTTADETTDLALNPRWYWLVTPEGADDMIDADIVTNGNGGLCGGDFAITTLEQHSDFIECALEPEKTYDVWVAEDMDNNGKSVLIDPKRQISLPARPPVAGFFAHTPAEDGFQLSYDIDHPNPNGQFCYKTVISGSPAPSTTEITAGGDCSQCLATPDPSTLTTITAPCPLERGQTYDVYGTVDSDGAGTDMSMANNGDPQTFYFAEVPHDPVNCIMGEWQSEPCSVTCGSGTQVQTRTVLQQPANGGSACSDELTQIVSCDAGTCPTDSGPTVVTCSPYSYGYGYAEYPHSGIPGCSIGPEGYLNAGESCGLQCADGFVGSPSTETITCPNEGGNVLGGLSCNPVCSCGCYGDTYSADMSTGTPTQCIDGAGGVQSCCGTCNYLFEGHYSGFATSTVPNACTVGVSGTLSEGAKCGLGCDVGYTGSPTSYVEVSCPIGGGATTGDLTCTEDAAAAANCAYSFDTAAYAAYSTSTLESCKLGIDGFLLPGEFCGIQCASGYTAQGGSTSTLTCPATGSIATGQLTCTKVTGTGGFRVLFPGQECETDKIIDGIAHVMDTILLRNVRTAFGSNVAACAGLVAANRAANGGCSTLFHTGGITGECRCVRLGYVCDRDESEIGRSIFQLCLSTQNCAMHAIYLEEFMLEKPHTALPQPSVHKLSITEPSQEETQTQPSVAIWKIILIAVLAAILGVVAYLAFIPRKVELRDEFHITLDESRII